MKPKNLKLPKVVGVSWEKIILKGICDLQTVTNSCARVRRALGYSLPVRTGL